jgi:hypothetical protein
MSSTARTVLPTDLVALVSYDGRVYANEAVTLDRIGTHDSPHPLEAAFEQWFSFATGRHTWISVKGPTLRGLISARKRGSKLAWEIDCLIHAEDTDDGVLMSLLDQVTEAAGRSGALRIFVRLPASSLVAEATSRCAFAPYLSERVYRREQATSEPRAVPEGLRRRAREDVYGVFQLYNALVPDSVRRYEALTFTEWRSTQEHIGRATQYVLEQDGRVSGWMRFAHDGDIGRFDVLGGHDALDALIDGALARLANRSQLYALVPEHQPLVAACLEERGFEPAEEYTVLSRRTVHPVKETRPAAVVQTTFG